MNCASQAVTIFSANSCTVASSPTNTTTSFVFFKRCHQMESVKKQTLSLFRTRASSTDESDCNIEECAPEKEVGKVSVEWLAGEKTKVSGTFPPRKRGWTGYIEKDTAGQTNIYSVEPSVYVAESGISSGTAGSSSDGAENTKAIAGGFALIALAGASSILLQVAKSPSLAPQAVEYSGPSLSYYIDKFKPQDVIQTSAPPETESSTPIQPASSEAPAVDAPIVDVPAVDAPVVDAPVVDAPSSIASEEAKETYLS